MEETKNFIIDLLSKHPSASNIFKRNLIKEYLQTIVLSFIYSHKDYSRLVFYGGSCLSFCFGLPRLSEDLDFVELKKKIKLSKLAESLKEFFEKQTDLGSSVKIQKGRIYLKFPILKEIGLANFSESAFLFIKIEIFSDFDFCKRYKIEFRPIFKFNKPILVKTFDLPTLFATKLKAILYRKWEKTDKKGKTLIKVKGRDYFDLLWYLQKEVKPNMSCLTEFKRVTELKALLLEKIAKIDSRSLQLDLENLIEDRNYVFKLSKSLKEILVREIQEKLA